MDAQVWQPIAGRRGGNWEERPGGRPYLERYYYRVPAGDDPAPSNEFAMVFCFLDYGNAPTSFRSYTQPQMLKLFIPNKEYVNRRKRKHELSLLMPVIADALLGPVGSKDATRRPGMVVFFRGTPDPKQTGVWNARVQVTRLDVPSQEGMTVATFQL